MFRKKVVKQPYDREKERPVIRASICNGEQVAGFRNLETGKFTEIMLIKDSGDMREFLEKYGIAAEEIKKEY